MNASAAVIDSLFNIMHPSLRRARRAAFSHVVVRKRAEPVKFPALANTTELELRWKALILEDRRSNCVTVGGTRQAAGSHGLHEGTLTCRSVCWLRQRSSSGAYDREGMGAAQLQIANPLGRLDQRADLGRRIMRRHMLRFMTQECFTIFEAHSGHPQPVSIGMFEVVNSNAPESCRARPLEVRIVTVGRPAPGGLPAGIVDLGDGLAFVSEDKFRVLAAAPFDDGSRCP